MTLNFHILDDDDDKNAEASSLVISTDATTSCFHGVERFESYHQQLAPLLILEQKLIAMLSDEEGNEQREATRLTAT